MPTLVITTEGSALAEAQVVREHLRRAPQAELVAVPSESYHIAAAQPDQTAQTVLGFINRQG